MQSIKKTIHYKSAQLTGGINLQAALKAALAQSGTAGKPIGRQQRVNPDEDSVIFINRIEEYSGMLFGQLIFLETGKRQPYITVVDSADYYSINALASDQIPDEQQSSGNAEVILQKRREFVDSILYFGIFENHVVVLQSAALKTRELEAHLSWVLRDLTKVMPNTSVLILKDKPAESVIRKMEKTHVKTVKIGAPITSEQVDVAAHTAAMPSIADQDDDATSIHASKVKFVPSGAMAKALQAFLPDIFSALDLDEALDDANLHVALEVTFNRKTSQVGQKVLDHIATSLRHMPESDVAITLQGGGQIKGDELKLSGGIKVQYTPLGLIDEAVLFFEMHRWLNTHISSQEIDATAN